MKRTKIKELLTLTPTGQSIDLNGWVRSFRNNQFIDINDGSTIKNIQAVVELNSLDEATVKKITTGACVSIKGELIPSLGKGQAMEVKVKTIEILGECDPENYPLQLKNRPSLEYLREIAHLRSRTNTFGAVMRVRHAMAYAVHKFFNDRGFYYIHTPVITGSDAEGAGAIAIIMATTMGIPVSTTHTITGAIVGVGATNRFSAVRWGIAGRIVWAWVLTIPASGLIAALCYFLLRTFVMP